MNALDLLSAPLAQAVGWALLHLLWQATIVAGILAASLALLQKQSANVRYGASCAALMLVFVLFVGTAWRAYEPRLAPSPSADVQQTQTSEEKLVPVTRVPILIAAAAADSWRDRALQLAATAQQSLPSIVAIWLAGVIVLSSRLLVSWVHARRLIHSGTRDVSAQWQQIAARLSDALGLKRAVQLVESASVEVPSVIGSLRPVILLPASALTGMTVEQLEMVLAHELAHIRRHDFFVNLLQAVVETLMFYHPAVWWMSRRVRVERENCCDDLAIAVCGNPLQYARALARLEELRAHAPAMAVAANGGSLIDRVRRIAMTRMRAESSDSGSRWAAAIAMLSVVIIALAVPSLPALADRDAKKKDEAKQEKKSETTINVVEDADAEADAEAAADAEYDAAVDAAADADAETEDYDDETEYEIAGTPAMAAVAPAVAPTPRAPVVAGAAAPAVAPAPAVPAAVAMLEPVEALEPENETQDAPKSARKRGKSSRKFGTSGKLTVDELIQLSVAGVTPQYIEKMRAVFPGLTLGDAISLKNMGVTPEYVAAMKAAGVNIDDAGDATSLAAMGVTTDFVKKLAAAGYDKLTVSELTRLAAAGVNAEFIKEMAKYRDKN